MYTTLQYFLKSYCTLSIHEDEIVSVMEEFIEQEDEEIVLKLRDELINMKKKNAWEEACVLAAKQGNRMWSLEETKDHLETFYYYCKRKRRDLITPFSLYYSVDSIYSFGALLYTLFEICPFDITSPFCVTFLYVTAVILSLVLLIT